MRRLFGRYVYGDQPRAACFWDSTCDIPEVPTLDGSRKVDVAIIGAGFTGLNAALRLAQSGASVVVLDAKNPGWGASGRNGGFCCLGGGIASDTALDKRFGQTGRLEWRATEKAAVQHVAQFLQDYRIDADVHSDGETVLAHKQRHARAMDLYAKSVEENYAVTAEVHSADDLEKRGMSAGFHGGVTNPIGFALNPRAYVAGLTKAAMDAGAQIFGASTVQKVVRVADGWRLDVNGQTVVAEHVILATNGYSSEDVPDWLAGRYMPVQSNVAITRPLSAAERASQGWSSHQMCFDTKSLLHYFHMLPDNRMLFGMRGGLFGSARADQRAHRRLRKDFRRIFSAWKNVELTHHWSGMACLARNQLPFVGPIPNAPGIWCALAYHGNGIAMGSFAGRLIGDLVSGRKDIHWPVALRGPFDRFPLGRFRRAIMPPVYAALLLGDL